MEITVENKYEKKKLESLITLITYGRSLNHEEKLNIKWGHIILDILWVKREIFDSSNSDLDIVYDEIKEETERIIQVFEDGENDSRCWRYHKYYDAVVKLKE